MDSEQVPAFNAWKSAILSVGTTFGTALMLTYFYRIGFIPSSNFVALGVVFATYTTTAVIVVLDALMIFLLPGLVLIYFSHLGLPQLPRREPSIVEPQLAQGVFVERHGEALKSTAFSVFGGALFAMSTYEILYLAGLEFSVSLLIGGASALLVLVTVPVVVPDSWRRYLVPGRYSLAQLTVCQTLLYLFWIPFLSLGYKPLMPGLSPLETFGLTIGLAVVHITVYATQHATHRERAVIAVSLLALFFTFGNAWNKLSDGIMKYYGLGMIPSAQLALTEEGCDLVEFVTEWKIRCEDKTETGSELRWSSPLGVLIATGPEYIIVQDTTLAQLKPNFRIPAKEVRGVRVAEPTKTHRDH